MRFDLNKVKRFIRLAIKEDIGNRDVTTVSFIPKDKIVEAIIVAKEGGVICGQDVAKEVFNQINEMYRYKKKLVYKTVKKDGQFVKSNDVIARLKGYARTILSGERVALNFLQHLSGISTETNRFVKIAKPYGIKVFDTRKTTPNLRYLEKYAVRCGGGYNHRFGLYDMVLIKDNHLKIIKELPLKTLKELRKKYKVQLEVDKIDQLTAPKLVNVDYILLDNFSLNSLEKVLKGFRDLNRVEVSGRVTLKTFKKLAILGVKRVSIGRITHSVKALDISLDIV